jgi:hypothetical protein
MQVYAYGVDQQILYMTNKTEEQNANKYPRISIIRNQLVSTNKGSSSQQWSSGYFGCSLRVADKRPSWRLHATFIPPPLPLIPRDPPFYMSFL